MDNAYQPIPPNMIEQAMSRKDSTQQLPGEVVCHFTSAKEAQPTAVQQLYRITTTFITS